MIKGVLKCVLKCLYRVKVNSEASFNSPRQLIISNHQSFLDGILLGLFLPIEPTFVVHTTVLNNKFFKMVLSLVDYVAVDTSKPMAMKKVAELIRSGKPVVIFPEGRITLTGNLMKVYEGSGFIAYKTEAKIIPVYLDGAVNTRFSRKHKHPRKLFSPVTISVGKEQEIVLDESLKPKEKRKRSGEQMRRILQETMFEFQPKETLFQRLLRVKNLYGANAPIMYDKDQLLDSKVAPLKYKDFILRVFALGRLMTKVSEKNEAIGVLLPNVAVTPAIIFGLNVFNRIPAMLNYTLGSQGLQLACETTKIKKIVTSRAFLEAGKLQPLVDGLKDIQILYLEDLKQLMTIKDKLWLMGYATRFPEIFAKNQTPEDTAVILFTSGSEAAPKGVVLSNRALLANVDQCRTVIDLNPEDKVLNSLPLFHSFGLTGGTLLPLLTGTPTILYPSPLHYRIIPEVAYEHRCSVIFGTNTFFNQYGKNAHPADFGNMKYVVAGAEKLSDEVRNMWLEKFGIRIFEGYGSTECSPVISVNTPVACKFGTVGLIMPGLKYKLNPVEGVDKGGEFWVKGPNLMTGYMIHSNPGVVQFPSPDGWYNTGDIVAVDDNGYLSIQGRMKRFIKIAGEMVSLEVVEKIARASDAVNNHAATSKPDATKGEMAVLFTTSKTLSRTDLSVTAKSLGIGELMIPKQIIYVDAIPVLGTGKTDYVTLKKLANQN